MGTVAHIVITGGTHELADFARNRLEQLEQRWSRFRPDSEISRINQRAGEPTAVSADTYLLVARSIDMWRVLGGAFDPTVLSSMHAIGYDRTFADIVDKPIGALRPSPGCSLIQLDPHLRTVRVPVGVGIDPGGIGKGLAADLLVDELMKRGAAGACVNMGGDLRVEGEGPNGGAWALGIADPYTPDQVITTVYATSGALVTSTTLLRAWLQNSRPVHHLINPRTGAPAATDLTAVTVLSGQAWWAEALAKAALVAGSETATQLIPQAGATGILVRGSGHIELLPGLQVATAA
jgi:FAD:protein FMN transferase